MCLTVGRQSRDHRPLSRDPSVTFYKKFPNCLKRLKTLFDSRPTVAWPPTTVAWPFRDFFQNFPKLLETSKNIILQSADGRVTSTTVAWPFSDFFQNFPKSLETSKKRCLTVGRRSRDLRPLSRDRSVTFFKKNSNCLKRRKNVVWQSADSRMTSDHCHVTVQRLFSKNFIFVLKRRKNVVWQSADGRVTSDHIRVTSDYCRVTVQWLFSKIFLIAWNIQKRYLTVGRRSRDLNHCRVTVQWLFSKILPIAWYLGKQLFDSRPTVASAPTWLERRENVVWKSGNCHVKVRALLFPWFFSYGITYCLADVFLVLILILFLSFCRTAWPRISSYRNGSILEILTSYQR